MPFITKNGHSFKIKDGQHTGNYNNQSGTIQLETTPKGLVTGIPSSAEKGFQKGIGTGYTAYIHPDQYLKLIGRGDVVGSAGIVKAKEARLANASNIEMPFITIDADTKRISNQEGRHTATALSNLGVKVMPISVVSDSGGRSVRHIPFDEIKQSELNKRHIPSEHEKKIYKARIDPLKLKYPNYAWDESLEGKGI